MCKPMLHVGTGIRLGLRSAAVSCPHKGTTNTIKHGTGMSFHAVEREQAPLANTELERGGGEKKGGEETKGKTVTTWMCSKAA